MPTNETFVFIHLDDGFVPAGLLKISQTGPEIVSEFAYGRRYLERSGAAPLDPLQLPLTKQTYHAGGLFRVFQDSGPDAWGRHLLDRAAEEYGSTPTEFEYLTVLDQENRMGALAFGPDPGQEPRPYAPKWRPDVIAGDVLDLAEMIEIVDRVLNYEALEPRHRRFLIRGSSVGGAQPKAATEFQGRQWIAKFSRDLEQWPTCRIELAAMNLAALCSIRTPYCRVLDVGGRDVFLIERFDRSPGKDGRRHFLSAMTLIGAESRTDGTYADIARAIRRFGAADHLDRDLEELFRRMVFNILCNNHDDHLKNHGFLFDQKSGMWRLSPAYDIVPQPQLEEEGDSRLTLGVGDLGRLATIGNALSRCEEFGLTRERAKYISNGMIDVVRGKWKQENQKAGISEEKIRLVREAYRLAEQAGE